MKINRIAFIGLGLIGGSIARRIREAEPDIYLAALDRSADSLKAALSDKTIDEILNQVDERIGGFDLIMLCTPVSFNAGYLAAIRPYLKENTIISDVGSTKTAIHEEVKRQGLEPFFVGGHPMAGSERSGYACSRANLLENAYYVITPAPGVSKERVEAMVWLAGRLSAIPLILDYRQHDEAVAAISHVPHLVASSLVNLVAQSDENGIMRQIAAGGFKDITRIASSSPEMWQQICFTNQSAIIPLMERYRDLIEEMINALKTGDQKAIFNDFVSSGAYRGSIEDRGSSTMNPEYSIFCDLPDKPGAISVIVSLLTYEGISIKNIGINHNRELQEGTMKIEFHDPKACETAAACLLSHHFPVYRKKP